MSLWVQDYNEIILILIFKKIFHQYFLIWANAFWFWIWIRGSFGLTWGFSKRKFQKTLRKMNKFFKQCGKSVKKPRVWRTSYLTPPVPQKIRSRRSNRKWWWMTVRQTLMMMMKFVSMKASNLIPEGSFEVWWQRYCPLRTKRVQFQLPNRHGVGPRLRNLSDLCNVDLHCSRREGRFAICKLAVSAALDSGATPFRFIRHSRRCSNYTHPKSPCWIDAWNRPERCLRLTAKHLVASSAALSEWRDPRREPST
jgi:hypothetical protein